MKRSKLPLSEPLRCSRQGLFSFDLLGKCAILFFTAGLCSATSACSSRRLAQCSHETVPGSDLSAIVGIDCTGLGGHDLGGPDLWHICIRSDRHGQNIYGPSLATTEAVLHSSARVSLLTYQTVIGVRYLELVKYLAGKHRFGRFLTDFSQDCQSCGMPPSDTCAVQDIDMVRDLHIHQQPGRDAGGLASQESTGPCLLSSSSSGGHQCAMQHLKKMPTAATACANRMQIRNKEP